MTQTQKMYQYMKENGSITSLDASNKLKIMSPTKAIHTLKTFGYEIHTEYVSHGKGHPFAVWSLYEQQR